MSDAAMQRRRWSAQVDRWNEHVTSSAAFASIRDAALARAGAAPGERAVDLGAGTGFLTLPLAATVRQVLAVDIARPMLERLVAEAHRLGLSNVEPMCANLAEVDLPDGSVDLVVSSYALHHLSDEDKRALVRRSSHWLRPGGRLVIADMMLGRGTSKRDREIVWRKVRRMVRKGPGGLWRIAKNSARFTLRRGAERPASPRFWVAALQEAGFTEVGFEPIVEEAGLVAGHMPAAPL
jgi:ubiquinone/menaquinone biosynthesis C-methylase UbiE